MIERFDSMKDSKIKFLFNRFIFECIKDEMYITDLMWRKKYKLQFSGERDTPFIITLKESE